MSYTKSASGITGRHVTRKRAFHLLNRIPKLQSLMEQQLSGFSDQEMRWLMMYLFARLDPAFKMHVAEYNKDFKNALTNLNLPHLIQENRGLTADIRGRNVQVLKGYSNMQEPEVQQVPFMEQMWE